MRYGCLLDLSSVIMVVMYIWKLNVECQADRINLFTARHEPGRLIHSFVAHKGPISSLSLTLDETGFFSGGWDGSTHVWIMFCINRQPSLTMLQQWDLNTGQKVRSYTAHGAQISAVAVRPMAPPSIPRSPSPMDVTPATVHINGNGNATTKPHDSKTSVPSSGQQPQMQPKQEDITMQSDTRSDTSYDDLFDEPDGDAELNLLGPGESLDQPSSSFSIAMPGSSSSSSAWLSSQNATVAAPENAPPVMPVPVRQVLPQQPVKLAPKMPPLLDASNSPEMSPDLLMTASIDGQIVLWDRRVSAQNGAGSNGVGRLTMNSGTPPWCVSVRVISL
jgi:transcriptional activator SPT8